MIPEKIQFYLPPICLIIIGSAIYFFKYRGKEKPKSGVKREKFSEYIQDYGNLKLYWGSISFIIVGIALLVAMGIIDLVFS